MVSAAGALFCAGAFRSKGLHGGRACEVPSSVDWRISAETSTTRTNCFLPVLLNDKQLCFSLSYVKQPDGAERRFSKYSSWTKKLLLVLACCAVGAAPILYLPPGYGNQSMVKESTKLTACYLLLWWSSRSRLGIKTWNNITTSTNVEPAYMVLPTCTPSE